MPRSEVRNAVIESVSIGFRDACPSTDGVLVSCVHLSYGQSKQGFGGFMFGPSEGLLVSHWILRLLGVANATEWGKLTGKPVRVRIEDGLIVAIGPFLGDKPDWFEPRVEFPTVLAARRQQQ